MSPPAKTRQAAGVTKLALAGLALMIAGLGVVTAAPRKKGRLPPPRPRKPVDIERYLGKWHEFARYTARPNRERDAVTAEYSWRPDGLIRVVTISHRDGLHRTLRWTETKARPVAGSGNTKLKIAFWGRLFWGDYWILDHAEDYSWSIAGEGSRRRLWIMTRDPVPSAEVQALLWARVQSFGYDTSRLHRTMLVSA